MPRNPLVVFVSLLALATSAAGPPPPITLAPTEAGRGGPPPKPLFISPSGEPFRTAAGRQAWFAACDADHDGRITPAEFRADAQRFFRLLDTDANGSLDGFEVQAYEQNRAPEITGFAFDQERAGERAEGGRRRGGKRAPGGEHPGRMKGAGQEGAARYSLINDPEPVASGDTDFDGKVTLAEWLAITDRRFEKLDKLKAGSLTLDGLSAKPAKK